MNTREHTERELHYIAKTLAENAGGVVMHWTISVNDKGASIIVSVRLHDYTVTSVTYNL